MNVEEMVGFLGIVGGVGAWGYLRFYLLARPSKKCVRYKGRSRSGAEFSVEMRGKIDHDLFWNTVRRLENL